MMPQSPSQQASWRLTQFSQSPSAAPSYFPESRWWSEISYLLKVILILGICRSPRAPNLGCSGAELRGWFDVSPKNSAQDMMHERARCGDEAANHHLPMAAAFWMNHQNSFHRGMLKLNAKSDRFIALLSHLNIMATQYTCSLNAVYHPHWLVQWSHHCSHMCTPVHSPWLPGYMDVVQTVLITLTMAGLFLDRPRMFAVLCMFQYSSLS